MLLKANLKDKKAEQDDDDDSDWESVEEDAPVVRLEELLANMNIEGKNDEEYDDEDDDEDNDGDENTSATNNIKQEEEKSRD